MYWVDDPCSRCERSDNIHVAKRIRDGLFIWQGITAAYYEIPDDFPTNIRSVEDWKEVMITRKGYLEDEYGDRIHADMLFLPKITDDPRNVEYVRNQVQKYPDMWLDAEGNLFSGTWFS